MAKRKFIEKRRQERSVECKTTIDPRGHLKDLVSFLENLKVDFETHWSGDNEDDYDGFKLSYDLPWDRTWYIVKNPFGGNDLELAIESGFDLSFGDGCWSFRPTENEFGRFCETIKAIIEGHGATVKFCEEGEVRACAVLSGDALACSNDLVLMERIVEKDWYRTNRDFGYCADYNLVNEFKKELRRTRSRCGWRAYFEYFNPANNKRLEFGKAYLQERTP